MSLLDLAKQWKRPPLRQRDPRRYADADPAIRHLLGLGWSPTEIKNQIWRDSKARKALPTGVTEGGLYRHICRLASRSQPPLP